MRIEMLGSNILVRLDAVKEEMKGKIVLPGLHAVPTRIGKILGVGPKVDGFKVGERILVNYYNGVEMEIPRYGIYGDMLRVVTDREILGRILDEDNPDVGELKPE